jgi:hypothetical protein
MRDDTAIDEIEALIGQSAGHICYHDFYHGGYHTQVLSEAAGVMWENFMSPWEFVEMWNNGTTLWRSPEGDATATVTPEGEIHVEGAHDAA